MNLYTAHMRWKPFILLHLTILLLIGSWFLPYSKDLWNSLDTNVFHFLNSCLEDKPFMQIFWALANVKLSDIYGAIFMASFFLLYIFEAKGPERAQRLSQFFYVLIWGEIGILFTKEVLGPLLSNLHLIRASPTLIFHDPALLSKAIPWLKVKDSARSSFPSDHGEILIQWAFFVWFFCRWRYAVWATLWAIFFMLPRLIAGAHWITDVLIGSVSVACIIVTWACFTPIYGFSMNFLKKIAYKLCRVHHEDIPNTCETL
ncbi:MAG: hypothetical protein JWO53_796 [Chlamydiia bacterium]|nr:hypothetical protein [Chlamydiia bacterium]